MLSLLSRSLKTTTVRTLQAGSLVLRGSTNRFISNRSHAISSSDIPKMGFSSSKYDINTAENQTFVPWELPQMARSDKDGDHASPPPEGVPPPVGGDHSNGDNAASAPPNNDGKPPKKGQGTVLKSVPVTSMRLDSAESSDKGKEESFLLFSSGYPILPFNKQQGVIKTGHLKVQHMNQQIAYFLTTGKDEIYTIGYVLDTKVNAEIKKGAPKDNAQGLPETSAYITTKKGNSRVRLTEIVKENDCIFAKAVPYKDRPLTATEKKINVDNEMISVMNYAMAIKKLASHERVDMFMDFEFSNPQALLNGLTKDKIDEMVFKMLFDLMKLSNITKENITPFVQQVIEERSYVNRVILMRKKLEELYKILEIVTNSSRASDDYFNAAELQHRARLAIEFIRSSYLSSAGGQGNFPGGQRPPSPGRDRPQGGNHQSQPQQQHQAPPAPAGQAKEYMEKLNLIKDAPSRDKVRKEIERFAGMEKGAERFGSEYHKIQTYLEEVFAVPYEKYSEEFWDVDYARGVLDKRMFGMEKVKERITEMIAVNRLKRMNPNNKDRKGFVVMLYGPPGVGKTSIAKTIGESLKRETRFISFAGVTDPHFMKGHRRTYVDSQPGVFIKELIKAKTMNPVFVIDEVDKLGKGNVGADPYYSLMEILNPEENANFVDHYLDIKVDFSQAIFVLTANDIFNMIEPLRNRLEIIEIPGYLTSEKLAISKQHILPKVQKNYGFPEGSIQMDDPTIMSIIKGWCYYESGCRHLTRCFEKIARKHAVEVQSTLPQVLEISQPGTEAEKITTHQQAVEQPPAQANEPQHTQQQQHNQQEPSATHQQTLEQPGTKAETATPVEPEPLKVPPLIFDSTNSNNMELIRTYLGSPVFDESYERAKKKKLPVGAVNVLTVAGLVGNVLLAECVYDYSSTDKKGSLSASGNLKKVISESLTVAKINAHRFLTAEQSKFLAERNVHIHFMHGGVPKDGPSAGISICTAYLSLVLNKEVASDLSMTGELSLHGAVWKIGGVQEKVAASKALDIKRIILPFGNLSDFLETPKELQKDLTVYCVKEYKEVFAVAFGEQDKDYTGIINMVKDGKFIPADEKAVLPNWAPTQPTLDTTGGQQIQPQSVTPTNVSQGVSDRKQ